MGHSNCKHPFPWKCCGSYHSSHANNNFLKHYPSSKTIDWTLSKTILKLKFQTEFNTILPLINCKSSDWYMSLVQIAVVLYKIERMCKIQPHFTLRWNVTKATEMRNASWLTSWYIRVPFSSVSTAPDSVTDCIVYVAEPCHWD